MQYAPFLLQAFAARVLASKENETLSRDDLKKHGYDVEMLVEMIAEYASLPEGERAFVATATDTQIFLARKANLPAPLPPMMTVPHDDGAAGRHRRTRGRPASAHPNPRFPRWPGQSGRADGERAFRVQVAAVR
jgi:hypothetical protein